MEAKRQKHNWGSTAAVIGSWVGGALMLAIMQLMTPSIATIGPNINQMAWGMNRGINSFTNPTE